MHISFRKVLSGALLLLPLAVAACGEEPEKVAATRIIEEPRPKDAVAEIKLQLESFRDYYYCDAVYPKTCDTVLKQAYVLPRETGAPFQVVLFNNQDPKSTAAIFDYLTVEMETKTIATEGHFEMEYSVVTSVIEKKGKPLWGIPE